MDKFSWNNQNIGSNVKIIDDETVVVHDTSNNNVMSNIGKIKPGKYYYEMTFTAPSVMVGVCTNQINNKIDGYCGKYGWFYFPYYGYVYTNSTHYECGKALDVGSILGVLIDLYNYKLYFSGNGITFNKGFDLPKNNEIYIALSYGSSWSDSTCKINYGQHSFKYKPKGYIAFNSIPPKYAVKKDNKIYNTNQEYFKDGKFDNIGERLKDDQINSLPDNILALQMDITDGKVTTTPIDYFDKFKILIYKEENKTN